MKVAILTMSNGINYGNRLQNYAVQKVLESVGCEVETIKNFTSQRITSKSDPKRIIKYALASIYEKVPFVDIKFLNRILRNVNFNKFTKNYIKQTKYIITKDYIPTNICNMYDYFICGSDQIWNPEFKINSEIDFLTFANKGQRIAYAPSFGVSKLPEYCIDSYKKWINEIDCLSVREQVGADIIKELTGRNAIVLVDPTLMLSKDEWLSIAKKPKIKLNKKYILTYFLGKKDNITENRINKIAKKYDLEVINLLDISHKFIYSADPSEFLWLINNSELVCTDSFHGSVFSLIFQKAFMVFERKDNFLSMNSRLDTLLAKFDMESRRESNIINEDEVFNIDFSKVNRIINNEKDKTFKYIKEALNIKDER